MGWSWAYLGVTVFGALLVLNALRPLNVPLLAVPSFFAGWYTGELPVWHIVWQAAATVGFAFSGAFGHWPGWVGLGVAVGSWIGLGVLARISYDTRAVFMRVEEEVPLPSVEDLVLPRHGGETMWRLPRLAYPLPRPARSISATRNIDYAGDGKYRHRLDVITRRNDPPTGAPVLIHIHGGAWIMGNKREQGFPLMYELARRDWVCATINYSLSPRGTWPDQIVDCKRAIAWVKSHIAEYGGDPAFIGLSGGSAGGHLSALAALTPNDPQFQPGFEDEDTSVDACVPMYGVYDMTCGKGTPVGDSVAYAADGTQVRRPSRLLATSYDDGLMRLLERQVFKKRLSDDVKPFEQASPLYRVNPDAPPFFVIHGATDTLVPVSGARKFVEALRAVSKSPVLYAELPHTQHAFDVLPSMRSANAVAAIVRFLEAVRHETLRGQRQAAPDHVTAGVRPNI